MVLVFVGGAALMAPPRCIAAVCRKNRNNFKCILLNMDSFHASSLTNIGLRPILNDKIWEKVYTFDKNDALEFGFKDINLAYFSTSRLPNPNLCSIKSDVFFAGGLKGGRENLIMSLFNALQNHGVKTDFVLNCVTEQQWKDRKHEDKITYLKSCWLPYSEILQRTMNTNCVIEILQQKQASQSVRYFEALYYNKKLLTNNRHIFELPYYDKRYMHYFEKPEDIDFDWLMKKEDVNYGYKNDFSAIHFAEMLKSDFYEF